jgi:hypothetical protein
MKHIKLHGIHGNGKFAQVDDSDYDWINKHRWWISGGYAATKINGKETKMHHLIKQIKSGEISDHIDRIKLNNTRDNIRITDKKGNSHNQEKRKNTKNKYKGVYFREETKTWLSYCRMNGKKHFCGYYRTEEAAAHAYNKKGLELSDYFCPNEINIPIKKLEEMIITDRCNIIHAYKRSKYKGVSWHKETRKMKIGKWVASVRINNKVKHLGYFEDEKDAAIAHNEGVIKYNGKLSDINIID